MHRVVIFGAAAGAVAVGIVWLRPGGSSSAPADTVVETARPPEPSPLCPWREPERDLRAFFPDATQHHTETRIMSGRRLELSQALGHAPAADELSLHVHRVLHDQEAVGAVLTKRVKGESGAIEIVLAVDAGGRVRGVRCQRLREPSAVAAALQEARWLAAFSGKSAGDRWRLGEDIPAVPPEAVPSAQAVVEGVHTLLVLFGAAERADLPVRAAAHN